MLRIIESWKTKDDLLGKSEKGYEECKLTGGAVETVDNQNESKVRIHVN